MLKARRVTASPKSCRCRVLLPIVMSGDKPPAARMMSLMSNEQVFEVLAGYRFQRRVIGVDGRGKYRQMRDGRSRLSRSVEGYNNDRRLIREARRVMSASHDVWGGAGVHRFAETGDDRLGTRGDSPRLSTDSAQSRCVSRRRSLMPASLSKRRRRQPQRPFRITRRFDLHPPRGLSSSARRKWCSTRHTPSRLACCFWFFNVLTRGAQGERVRVSVNVSYFFWLK